MRRHPFLILTSIVSLTASLAACGGSNPGSGTQTLFVSALAQSDGSSNGSFMAVEVREGHSEGTLISDAVVTIEGDESGEFNLGWTGANFWGFKFGAYTKENLAWDTGWRLNVKRGEDHLDAYLVAPGQTTITAPLGGTTYMRSSGEPLVVQWKDGEGRQADVASVRFKTSEQANREFANDPMEYEVEPNHLQPDDDERIEVERRNEVKLEGGTPGSLFRAITRHRIEFRIE